MIEDNSSNSVKALATIKREDGTKNDLLLKIAYEATDSIDGLAGLEVERQIYSYLDLADYSPSVGNSMVGICRNFDRTMPRLMKKNPEMASQVIKELSRKYRRNIHPRDPALLILAIQNPTDGTSLDRLFAKITSNQQRQDVTSQVVFQVAYLLLVFEELGITHNNLNMANIIVQELSEANMLSFGIDHDVAVCCTVKYSVTVLDFDRSFKVRTKYNGIKLLNIDAHKMKLFSKNADWDVFIRLMNTMTSSDPLVLHIMSEKLTPLDVLAHSYEVHVGVPEYKLPHLSDSGNLEEEENEREDE